MKKVYCLYRVSTKNQTDKDDIPMQRMSCHDFAQKKGWSICKEFFERGVSGYKVSAKKRDAIQDLKTAAEQKEFDVLLVFMFDRLGRIRNETPFVLEWFTKMGIEVWSTQEGQQKFENDADYLLNYIRFWMAGGESEKTSLRVKTRLSQMVKEGLFTGGVCPFGYRFVRSGNYNKKGKELFKLEVKPEEAEIVRLIFYKTVFEGLGTMRLSALINEMGYRTHRGAKFQSNTINRILRNRIYTGRYERQGVISPLLNSLKIIEDNEYEEAQRISNLRCEKRIQRNNLALTTRSKSLLGGNLFCAHCGSKIYSVTYSNPVILANGSRKIYKGTKYICSGKSYKRCLCNGQTQYSSKKIDKVILEILYMILKKLQGGVENSVCKNIQEKTLKHRKKVYFDLLREKERLNEELIKLLAKSKDSKFGGNELIQAFQRSIIWLNEKISGLDRKIQIEKKRIEYYKRKCESDTNTDKKLIGLLEIFNLATNEEKKMIICKLISRIEIGRGYKVKIILNTDNEQLV